MFSEQEVAWVSQFLARSRHVGGAGCMPGDLILALGLPSLFILFCAQESHNWTAMFVLVIGLSRAPGHL